MTVIEIRSEGIARSMTSGNAITGAISIVHALILDPTTTVVSDQLQVPGGIVRETTHMPIKSQVGETMMITTKMGEESAATHPTNADVIRTAEETAKTMAADVRS